jgi:hypothetical protein
MPTDIDGLIEWKNIAYVIMEFKHRDNVLPAGQRLALERMTDDYNKAGKASICIIASHDTDNTDRDIDAANTIVTEYRYKSGWVQPHGEFTTREWIERFLRNLPSNPRV